jgi:hypothetical protein
MMLESINKPVYDYNVDRKGGRVHSSHQCVEPGCHKKAVCFVTNSDGATKQYCWECYSQKS